MYTENLTETQLEDIADKVVDEFNKIPGINKDRTGIIYLLLDKGYYVYYHSDGRLVFDANDLEIIPYYYKIGIDVGATIEEILQFNNARGFITVGEKIRDFLEYEHSKIGDFQEKIKGSNIQKYQLYGQKVVYGLHLKE